MSTATVDLTVDSNSAASVVVNLLWTGGWDSTFRLLDLVFRQEVTVQPWYVLDRERKSTSRELDTMQLIINEIKHISQESARRIRDVRKVYRDDIPSCSHLTAWQESLRVGTQYDWLARLAHDHGLAELEVGAVKGGGRMYETLRSNVKQVCGTGGATLVLVDNPTDSRLELFRRMSFPILDMTKREMRMRGEELGWSSIMRLTWFCHDPWADRPCGKCSPCLIAIKAGMAWRIPLLRQIRGRGIIAKSRIRMMYATARQTYFRSVKS